MRRPKLLLWLLAVPLALFVFGYLDYTVGMVMAAKARTGCREVLDRQVEAWNRGDLDGFAAGYWNSDGLTFFSGGTLTKGWRPTRERYRKRYQADGKEMGTLAFDELRVQPLGWNNAIATGRWKVVTSKDTAEGLFTLRLEKIDGKWVIVHDHTSAADPPKLNP